MRYIDSTSTVATKFDKKGELSQAEIDSQIEKMAAVGRIAPSAINIVDGAGFSLPSTPSALVRALNGSTNDAPFNGLDGYEKFCALFNMAQKITNSGRVKNLPALIVPRWVIEFVEKREKAAKKAAEKAAKKAAEKAAEKAAKKDPTVVIATIDKIKADFVALPSKEKAEFLAWAKSHAKETA